MAVDNSEFPREWTFSVSPIAAALLDWRPRPALQWALHDACACRWAPAGASIRDIGLIMEGNGLTHIGKFNHAEAFLGKPGNEGLSRPAPESRTEWVQLFHALGHYGYKLHSGIGPTLPPSVVKAVGAVLLVFEDLAAGRAPLMDIRLACYMAAALPELKAKPGGPHTLKVNL